MAYDFPASPAIGQEFASGAVTYIWNGTGWAIKGSNATDFVLKTGDVMSGDLIISKENPFFRVNKPTGSAAAMGISGRVNNVGRWAIFLGTSEPETGSRAGTNFQILGFDDAGANGLLALHIERTTGLGIVAGDPVQPLGIATKQYVENTGRAYAAPLSAMANRSITYNAACEISQWRPFNVPIPVDASGEQMCDGWHAFSSLTTGAATMMAVTDANAMFGMGFNNNCAVTITTPQASIGAGERLQFTSVVEGVLFSHLLWGTPNAQPITISFWSAHARAGLYSVGIRNFALDRSYSTTYTHAVANVAQFNTVTIPGCTDGIWLRDISRAVWVMFAIAAGSSFVAPSANAWHVGNFIASPGQVNGADVGGSVFRITGVTVMPGVLPLTALQARMLMRPLGEELEKCYRYLRIVTVATGQAYDATTFRVSIMHPNMRLTPTVGAIAPVVGATNLLTLTDELGFFAQSISNFGIVENTPNGGRYSCNTFVGLTPFRQYSVVQTGGQGAIFLNARV